MLLYDSSVYRTVVVYRSNESANTSTFSDVLVDEKDPPPAPSLLPPITITNNVNPAYRCRGGHRATILLPQRQSLPPRSPHQSRRGPLVLPSDGSGTMIFLAGRGTRTLWNASSCARRTADAKMHLIWRCT
jgi:hypothetical protein